MSTLKVLLTGGSGRLGSALREQNHMLDIVAPSRHEFDVTTFDHWVKWLDAVKPDVVIHTAAITDTQEKTDLDIMWRTNALAPLMMAHACRDKACPWWHISTDYVFDGERDTPYEPELPTTRAKGNYGQSKAWAEVALMDTLKAHHSQQGIITRIGWLMTGYGDFVDAILKQAQAKNPFSVVANQWGTPTFVKPLAQWMLEVLARNHQAQDATGHWAWCGQETYSPIWHLVMQGGIVSRLEWAQTLITDAGFEVELSPSMLADFPPRPQYCGLKPFTPGHPMLPSWREAQIELVKDWKHHT